MKRLKLLVALMISLLSVYRAAAENTDSLLSASVPLKRPYVVLNITSTDCIACRSMGVAVLNSLAGDKYKDKIVIVTDDRGMTPYFKDNSSIYGKYPVVCSRKLSAALSIGPLSTVALVQTSGIHPYLFANVNKDTLSYLAAVLSVSTPYRRFTIPDSLLSGLSAIQATDNAVLLTNDRVQLGLLYDRAKGTVKYLQPSTTDEAAEAVYDIFRKEGGKKLFPAAEVRKTVGRIGMSMVTICRADMVTGTAMFRLFSMQQDTVITGTDTNINCQMRNPDLLASGIKNGADPFNIASYSSCIPVDSVHYRNKCYMPTSTIAYEAGSGHFLFPVANYESGRKINYNGKEVNVTTDMCIAMMKAADNKTQYQKIWPIEGYDAMEAGLVYFRTDKQGLPVLVNNSLKVLSFPERAVSIPYASLAEERDTVAYLYEVSVSDSGIKFAAQTTGKVIVAGYFDLARKKATLARLDDTYSYFCINGAELLACKKSEDEDKWHVSLFRLP